MKRLKLLALIFLWPCLLFADPVDSLRQELEKLTNDSLRLLLLDEITFQASADKPQLSIGYAHQTVHLAKKLNNRKILRQGLHLLALNHYRLGNYDETLEYFRQVLRMFEEDKDLMGVARLHNNIGILYDELKQYEKALSYYNRSLEVKRSLGDSADVATTLSNIGFTYQKMGLTQKSYHYLMQALQLNLDTGSKEGLVYTYGNLGQLYGSLNKTDSALHFFNLGLNQLSHQGSEYEKAEILHNIAEIYLKQNFSEKAREAFLKASALATTVDARIIVKDCYKGIAETYKLENNWQKAYVYFNLYEQLKDSIFSEENLQKISDIESGYQVHQREKEIELLRKDARIQELHISRNEMLSNYLYSGLFLLLVLSLVLYQQYKIKNYSNTLLKKSNSEIAARNLEITDSIHYARTIQNSLLPQEENLKEIFEESFLYCEARNILNGDFFWVHQRDEMIYWAVVDCTGHGVPGALMTILAHNLLNQIVKTNDFLEPAQLLNELHRSLASGKNKESDELPNSLDLGICQYNRHSGELLYAGARRPLYLLEEDTLKVYQTANASVGNPYSQHYGFRQVALQPTPGSRVYLFTDGITDQFGGPQNKKFLHNRLQEVIRSMYSSPMEDQKRILSEAITRWRAGEEQTDDMLLLAVRLPQVT